MMVKTKKPPREGRLESLIQFFLRVPRVSAVGRESINKEAGHKPNFVSVIISLAGTVTGPVLAILPEGLLFRCGKG